MLEAALSTLGFLAGIHLTMTLLAQVYRVIDLWYAIGRYWLNLLARLSLSVGAIGLLYYLVEGAFLTGFKSGQVFFLTFHIIVFYVGRGLVNRAIRELRR